MKAAMQNLLSLPLFKGLASDELDTILGKVNALVKHFEKSDYIYLAGDAVESIGIVVAGTVQMIKEDIWEISPLSQQWGLVPFGRKLPGAMTNRTRKLMLATLLPVTARC